MSTERDTPPCFTTQLEAHRQSSNRHKLTIQMCNYGEANTRANTHAGKFGHILQANIRKLPLYSEHVQVSSKLLVVKGSICIFYLVSTNSTKDQYQQCLSRVSILSDFPAQSVPAPSTFLLKT